ncbi:uncharacterized protein LOC108193344 [Daucus carota subsp. sativus]|uniref:uncharacterized protein LOC108193344 n=1 Tax=Daucus carota subsp. sativus TaxID=79200 RepID=UPI0007B25301|nr:PREDICTED: uncharacterized protein LOC108193344 [Daucus carota subsp. sativus]
MGAAYAATTFFLLPAHNPTRFSRKLLVLRSSAISPPLIRRFRRNRKNYLRPKILRTRPDPVLLEPLFPGAEEILIDPLPDNPLPDPLIEETLKECDESHEVSVSDVNNNVGLGKFSKFTVFRVGLFLVGAFVVQTIFAVLLFGSGQNGIVDSENESRVLGLNGNGVGKSRVSVGGGGVVYVDEVEMRKKVREIQVMARDVREKERREGKNGNDGDLKGDDVGVDVTRIEKEVVRRLGRRGKGVKKMSVGYMRNDDGDKDGLVAEDINEALLVKKAESESIYVSTIDEAKGCRSLDDGEVDNRSAILRSEALEKTRDDSDGMELLDSARTVEKPNADIVRNDMVDSGEEDVSNATEVTRKKSSKGKGRVKLGKAEPLNGKAVKLDESHKLNGASSQRSTWWLNLPYVLAVVMRTGGDDQEANGLYRIKSTSHSLDDSSHVVAFEDRGDATNFCYLLQSFFEDLDNFSTDIIPIPIEDLAEAVESHWMEVVVVKKGQLQLYAGQPLSDVEMTLRSLVERS